MAMHYMLRVTTWNCDDGVGENTYFKFTTRAEAEQASLRYVDGPESTYVFPHEDYDWAEVPF